MIISRLPIMYRDARKSLSRMSLTDITSTPTSPIARASFRSRVSRSPSMRGAMTALSTGINRYRIAQFEAWPTTPAQVMPPMQTT